jgi:hypothetical protein
LLVALAGKPQTNAATASARAERTTRLRFIVGSELANHFALEMPGALSQNVCRRTDEFF